MCHRLTALPQIAAMILLAVACGGAPRTLPAEPRMQKAPWTVTYDDGSANRYTFSQRSAEGGVEFEYVPVRPEESSTGTYSGGEPASARLAAADPTVDELWRRIEALAADPELRAEDRAKGTGSFLVITPAGERRFIIEAGAALTDFDAFVRTFRR
jgi:hypothetical protein